MTATQPDYCYVGEGAVIAWHDDLLSRGVIAADPSQAAATRLLQEFTDSLSAPPPKPAGIAKKLRGWLSGGGEKDRAAATGLYFHGGVGRGKSFLMDGFYLQLPLERKVRAHFHQFMRRLHADMKSRQGEDDPLAQVAGGLKKRFDLICFDEFHVSDIADAMLLGRLLEILLGAGVRFVMTSNYPPSGLYPNGLARDRFLPTIALLEKRMRVFHLDGGEDYRRRHLASQSAWLSPSDEEAKRRLRAVFDRLACGIVLRNSVKLSGRDVPVVARSSDCVWLDFESLCVAPRSKNDYLRLAERYATVLLSDVPFLGAAELGEASRRFTWLVDVLYDRRVKLLIAAAAPPADIYGDAPGGESGRTQSRLAEMRGDDYWRASRRPADGDGDVFG